MKLSLAETEAEAAKAAEQRITMEASQLRNELFKQGSLVDSIQRIEASFAAQASQEKESLKEQAEHLAKQLSEARAQHTEEIKNLTATISDQEMRMKDVEISMEKATQEKLKATTEALKSTTELDALKKNFSMLEVQLRAAKRKLGEGGEEKDVEAELQGAIDKLKQEVESCRSEIATLKERSSTYQKLAQSREQALLELTEATNEFKQQHSVELEELKQQVEAAQKDSASRQEVIVEFTNDLASHRSERDKALADRDKQIALLRTEAEQCQKDADTAMAHSVSLNTEVVSLRAEVSSAQVRSS
jgi:nucleoprotein TPR